jgi:hypothetical protein
MLDRQAMVGWNIIVGKGRDDIVDGTLIMATSTVSRLGDCSFGDQQLKLST